MAGSGPAGKRTVLSVKDVPSPNFNARRGPPDMLVLHYTGMRTADEAVARLRDPEARVSAHYVVDEDGSILRLVAEEHPDPAVTLVGRVPVHPRTLRRFRVRPERLDVRAPAIRRETPAVVGTGDLAADELAVAERGGRRRPRGGSRDPRDARDARERHNEHSRGRHHARGRG